MKDPAFRVQCEAYESTAHETRHGTDDARIKDEVRNLFISVVLQNSAREYDKFYDYKVPEALEAYMQPGIRVLVPFGKSCSLREAFVMEVKDECSFSGLKEVSQVIDETPVLTQELLQLCQYMKKRYICTHDLAIRCMLPSGLGLQYGREVVLRGPGAIYDAGNVQNESDTHSVHADGQRDSSDVNIVQGLEERNEMNTDLDYTEAEHKEIPEAFCEKKARFVPEPEEQEIIDLLAHNNGRMSIDQLQDEVKKPIMKSLKKMEERGLIEIVSRFQMKAKSKTVRVAWPLPDMDEYNEMLSNNRIRNLNYIRIMDMLYEEGTVAVNELNMLGFSAAVLKNMEKKGYISFTEEPVERNPLDDVEVQKTEPLPPTKCQKEALDTIFEALASESFREILLHGVTGSGKTEVYLQAIQEVIGRGKTAIMLVPEIGLTPQTVRHFKGRFGDRVAVLHSRLSMGERFDQWNKIKNGEIRVVVGARSAVFAPLDNIGIIIIDEEHETSYKSERTPKYDARTIAAARCRYHKGLVLYGSATPSIENYHRAVSGSIKLVEMLERTNSNPLPEVLMVDMRAEMDNGLRSEFSQLLIQELQKNKAAGEQTILFINRRGYSNFLLCKNCGFIPLCPYCSVSLTWHQAEKRLVCHYCSYATAKPVHCPKCRSERIEPYGAGTQKVEEMLPGIEPGFSVIRMDFDTTSGKRGHQKVLDAFREQKIDVMVGTQMIAKGHDFSEVTLVGILNADSLLGSGDYRAAERTFQLITQAAGRAGRAEKHGRVVLQTYNPDEFSIQAAIKQDYKSFFQQEISVRKELNLPPFFQFGLIQISGKDRDMVHKTACKIHSDIIARKDLSSGIFLSDPAPSPIIKIRNRFRWRIILKHPSIKNVGRILEWIHDKYGAGGRSGCTVSVDINPVSMI